MLSMLAEKALLVIGRAILVGAASSSTNAGLEGVSRSDSLMVVVSVCAWADRLSSVTLAAAITRVVNFMGNRLN